MFIVSLEYGVSPEAVDALMPAHVVWLRRYYRSGLFIASGRKKPRTGGIILARSGNRKQLEDALARDPFIAKGAATFALIEFEPSMTAPGAEALKVL